MSTFLTRCLLCTAIQYWEVGAAVLWQALAEVMCTYPVRERRQ